MNLLVLGHSFARDLQSLGLSSFAADHRNITVKFSTHPGANYDTFIENPSRLKQALVDKPDIIVVILGGNSIKRDVTNFEVFKKCRTFYELLRVEAPTAVVISAQIELRFYKTPNRFGCPGPEDFKKKRNELNKFLNKLKLKNFMLIVAGPGRLDNQQYYRDEVHLNQTGLKVYSSILKTTVSYALQKIRTQ